MMSNVERIDSYIGDLKSDDMLFLYSLEPVSKLFYKINLAMIHYDEGRYRVAIAGESDEEETLYEYDGDLEISSLGEGIE